MRHSIFKPRAFTLIEMILVLVVIAVVAAITAPSLNGWSRGSQLRNAADQFIAKSTFARSQSVSQATRYRLQIESGNTFALSAEQDANFIPVGRSIGQPYELPDGFIAELQATNTASANVVDFFPSGMVTPARLKLTSPNRDSIVVECGSPGERFHVVSDSSK